MNIFITGGTTGIGLALAEAYLKDGHRVGICARDLAKLPSGFKEKHPNLVCFQCDVVNREELISAIESFSNGGLDLVIANAGRSVGSKSKTPNFEAARDIINVNVLGVLNTFEGALKVMIPQKRGHLVAIASVAGMVGLPGASAYCASKAAVLKLCESYQLDLRQFGIYTTAIAPGFVDTPLTRKNDHPMPFLMNSTKAATLIQKAIARKRGLFIFPLRMQVVIYLLQWMPRWLYRLVMGFKFANYSRQ